MKPDDDIYRDFILNQQQSRVPLRKIYTIKYFSLMLISIMMEGTGKMLNEIFQIQDNYCIMICIILAFFISSFSSYIGYRRLFILSYISNSVMFILVTLYGLFPSAWIYILMQTTSRILLSQIFIQIYGVWPSQFARIFIEFIFICKIERQIILTINFQYENLKDTICWIQVGIIILNIVPMLVSLNNFRSPETDSVFKDSGRLLSSIKIIIFNLLIASFLLAKPISEYIFKNTFILLHEDHTRKIMLIIFYTFGDYINSFVSKLQTFDYDFNIIHSISYSTNNLAFVYICGVYSLKFSYIYCLICNFFIMNLNKQIQLQPFFISNQYLLFHSIGKSNQVLELDFVSSHPYLQSGFAQLMEKLFFQGDNQLSNYIFDHLWIFFVSLIALVITLLFIFYQVLGFKEYLKNTKKHNISKVKYICLDVTRQQKRLFCLDCLLNNHPKHNNEKNNYIKDQKGLQKYIQGQIESLQKQLLNKNDFFVQRSIDLIKKIKLQIDKMLDNLKEIKSEFYLQNKIQSLQNQLQQVKRTKLNQINDQFDSQLLNMDFQQNRSCILYKIKQQCDSLMKNSLNIQMTALQEIQIEKLKNVEYEITQFDQLKDQSIYSVAVSQDSKQFISGSQDKYMRIWNYPKQTLIQEFDQNDQIYISKFTDDSSLLYAGTDEGLLCCYDVQNCFNNTYKKKPHHHSILNLYCINNNLVLTSSFDRRIIKTNTLLNQQLFVIQGHNDRIDGLDYNRSKDIIASCSKDNFIKLWDNKKGSLFIQYQNPYQSIINQVLFINKSDQLVSLDKSYINIWKIKYDTKELMLIKSIIDQHNIFNISLVFNQSLILLVCNEYIKFYRINGEHIHSIKHDVKEFYMNRQIQIDSMKPIIIQGKNQLKILNMKI